MNLTNDNNNNNNESSSTEDDYGFFCEFDQTISSDNNIDHATNNRSYKIDKNILNKLNNKYKYTILNTHFLPMLKKIPTYHVFNMFKNRSPKSSKVMPILDNTNYIENTSSQYNIKENTTLKNRILIHSVFILSFFISLLLLLL